MFSGEINLAIGQQAILKMFNGLPSASVLAVDGIYETYESTYAHYYPAWWMVILEKRYQIQRIVVLIYFQINSKFLILTLTLL